MAVFHYIPLHTSEAGMKYSRFNGKDKYTTKESKRLLRLPLYYNIEKDKVEYIINCIENYYKK